MSTSRNINKSTLDTIENISGKKLTFGNLIWAIRQGEEMSQVKFAEKLAVSRQYLCDLEHGRRFASPKAAAKYANLLGYSTKQFVRLCLQDLVDRDGVNLTIDVKAA